MTVSKVKFFLILLGFQITWISCVFGEFYNYPLLGIITGIIYLILFFFFSRNKQRAFKICFFFSLIGYIFDSSINIIGLFTIKSTVMVGYLPIWFIVLWPSFATLFVDVLLFLKNRPFVAALLGSFFAPPAYFIGITLGIANTNNFLFALITMISFWGLYLYIYSIYLKKFDTIVQ